MVSIGLAMADEPVRWRDDGKVDLRLPFDDDRRTPGESSITVDQADLGTLFGPDRRPFEGKTITILSPDGGPRGGISGPLFALRPVFEALSGATVEIETVPGADLYGRMMTDLRQGIGRYDGIMTSAFFYGDLQAGGHLQPIDDFMASGDFPAWSYGTMPAPLIRLHRWGGASYGVPNDTDTQILYYRRDILSDPYWRAAFRAASGDELPSPPRTWQELLDVASFFAGKNWDAGDNEADDGIVLHLRAGEQAHYHFQAFSASFAITPGQTVDRHHNVYWFDPTDMTPLIDGEGHVRALEMLTELQQAGPPEQIDWSLLQAWTHFLSGKSVFLFSWSDVGRLCQTRRSKIKGSCAAAMMPSAARYWDHRSKTWVERDAGDAVGNLAGASWHGVIPALAGDPRAAFAFFSLMAMEPVSAWLARTPWTGIGPGREHQLAQPAEAGGREDDPLMGGKTDWHPADLADDRQAHLDNLHADTVLPYLRIEGVMAYWDILDRHLFAAINGEKSPRQALGEAAASWEALTERRGRETLLEQHRTAIGLSD